MMLAQERVDEPVVGVAFTDAPEGLSGISEPDCAAVLWRRQSFQSFQEWIDLLDPGQLPKARMILRPGAVREAVRQCCDIAETPNGPERDGLIEDVASLAEHFADIMRAPYLRVRLDVVSTNACRKFHIDAVTARLICTYRGTGTQYGNAHGGGDPEQVFTAPTGAPIILRGTLWPEHPASGLRHRSPPIAGSGETRLLLVLDPLEAMESEIEHTVR